MQAPTHYAKDYRNRLGFASQAAAKDFLAAKNISAGIDFGYIEALNHRIEEILKKLNCTVHPSIARADIGCFAQDRLHTTYRTIRDAGILPRLNNQGRRPEEVLFSWLRGFVIADFFTPCISLIFGVNCESVFRVGQDDFRSLDTFRRGPAADIEIQTDGGRVRIEV